MGGGQLAFFSQLIVDNAALHAGKGFDLFKNCPLQLRCDLTALAAVRTESGFQGIKPVAVVLIQPMTQRFWRILPKPIVGHVNRLFADRTEISGCILFKSIDCRTD